MSNNEVARKIPFEVKAECFKKTVKEYFSKYKNERGGEDCIEVCLIREGYRAVLGAEEEINRLQDENEMLKIENAKLKGYKTTDWLIRGISPEQLEYEKIQVWKAEAYKEFYEKLHTEILAARDSNFKAKEERIAKSKEYGIPIGVEDSFLMYCDGKIHALDGIDYFAYETLKELVGEDNV